MTARSCFACRGFFSNTVRDWATDSRRQSPRPSFATRVPLAGNQGASGAGANSGVALITLLALGINSFIHVLIKTLVIKFARESLLFRAVSRKLDSPLLMKFDAFWRCSAASLFCDDHLHILVAGLKDFHAVTTLCAQNPRSVSLTLLPLFKLAILESTLLEDDVVVGNMNGYLVCTP